jgi:hypothetical protein
LNNPDIQIVIPPLRYGTIFNVHARRERSEGFPLYRKSNSCTATSAAPKYKITPLPTFRGSTGRPFCIMGMASSPFYEIASDCTTFTLKLEKVHRCQRRQCEKSL